MSGIETLALPSNEEYIYDGGIRGFYCCVYECIHTKRMPIAIFPEALAQPSLLEQKMISTDDAQAGMIRRSVVSKIGARALELTENAFFSCMKDKELSMLRFLLKGYKEGMAVPNMLGHPHVIPLINAERHLLGECHLLQGFVRFSDYDGVLVSAITPKNFVLPFIANHFIDRYSCEDFMIFDKTHKAALVYQDKKAIITHMQDIEFPQANEDEKSYRALWRQFYKTIAIEARKNHRCRMTHMPKRYWDNMTEFG